MDATRARRTQDRVRQLWYARYRQRRFARFLGFVNEGPAGRSPSARPILLEPLEASQREGDDPAGLLAEVLRALVVAAGSHEG